MRSGDVRVSTTITSLYDARDLPPESQWVTEDWGAQSDLDRFSVAFYRARGVVLENLTYHPRYEFTAVEFTGLDPDLRRSEGNMGE